MLVFPARATVLALLALILPLSACTSVDGEQMPKAAAANEIGVVEVLSGPESCEPSASAAPAGALIFRVTNIGMDTAEFYVRRGEDNSIVTEVENIAPNLTRDLVVQLDAGTYLLTCVPTMRGEGYDSEFIMNPHANQSAAVAGVEGLRDASEGYRKYVRAQADELLAKTEGFVDALMSGDLQAARERYPQARTHWERIEPVAESFGDLDPLLDLREADLESGQEWTGWHVLEKYLWPPDRGYRALTPKQLQRTSDGLLANTRDLVSRIAGFTFEPFQMANGAKELLDEVATGKVTGEEEIWSGTDLWDFQANIDGAQQVFTLLTPIVSVRNPELAVELERRFSEVSGLLSQHRQGKGFRSYGDLTLTQVRALAAAVDALAEPVSRLAVAVVN